MTLFVYGSLRNAELVRRLAGRSFVAEAAMLGGYRRFEPAGSYPYIAPDVASEVQGQVLRDVDDAALRAFDAYEEEGRLYRRTDVLVTVAGRVEPAQTYVGLAAAHRE